MTVWLDLEDLVRYFHHAARPTGIQRMSFEICRELALLDGPEPVRFCRHGNGASGFRAIQFAALQAGIDAAGASASDAAPVAVAVRQPPPPPAGRPPNSFVMRVAASGRKLPPHFRRPLGIIGRATVQILDALPDLARAARAEITPGSSQRIQIGGQQFELEGEEVVFAPGDWVVVLGAAWETPYRPEIFDYFRAQKVRLAVLAHDMIPELFPEWAVKANVKNFRTWLRTTVLAADALFAVSRSTAADLTECIHAMGCTAPAPVVLPVGSAAPKPAAESDPLTDPLAGTSVEAPVEAPAAAPESPAPYVLLVSTIEIRKNHALMFRIWRRLLRDLPAESVPTLVFAGKVGWLTADLMQQLENCDWLDGRIRFVASPSDAELARLYRGCLFTVFPSLYEGWGLPVTESLAFGKTVAASDRASIPEAGGPFCAYYDPENTGDAYAVIRRLIERPEEVAALEAKIITEYRPPVWADSARRLYDTLVAAPAPPLPLSLDLPVDAA